MGICISMSEVEFFCVTMNLIWEFIGGKTLN